MNLDDKALKQIRNPVLKVKQHIDLNYILPNVYKVM